MRYQEPETTDASLSLAEAATIIVGMVGAQALGEAAFQWIYQPLHSHLPKAALWLRYLPVVTMCLMIAIPIAAGYRVARQRFLVILCGITFVYLSVAHFRGSVMWPGFYDRWDEPRTTFHVALLLSIGLGWIVSKFASWQTLRTLAISQAVAGTAVAWIDSYRPLGIYSELGYGRHIACTLMLLVLLTSLAATKLGRQDEEGILSH